jgi:hypothetical protein
VNHDDALRGRLVDHALSGRYAAFVRGGTMAAIVGTVLFAIALAGEGSARAWQAFHVNWLFFTGLAGGSVALVAVYKIANAKWSGLILRFAQANAWFLPVSLLGLVAIFTVGYGPIYGPMHGQLHALQPAKAAWLSHGFMFARLVIGLGLLLGLGWRLVRADLVPDLFFSQARADARRSALYRSLSAGFDGSQDARDRQHARINRSAAAYIVVYALVFTLVAFDMIMALQPHWFSNLLGAFFFMASFLGAHTTLALAMLYGEGQLGVQNLISPKQRHDLGKMIFGFTVFWAYLMWSQFLVIWFGNLPEETGYVFARLWGPWRPLGAAVFLGMFLIPFAGLLGVAPKKTRLTLGLFAGISLTALWLERYLQVTPSIIEGHGPEFGVPEAGPFLLLGGLFLVCHGLFARTFPMVSPRLAEVTLSREVHHAEAAAEFEHEEAPRDYVDEDTIEHETGG